VAWLWLASRRVADALSGRHPAHPGGIAIRVVKPDWARFPFPGETKACGVTGAISQTRPALAQAA